MKTVTLYPARRGLIVRDPRSMKPLSEDGETKPKSGFWLRRMREGDVTTTPLTRANKKTASVDAKPVKPVEDAQ